MSKILSLPGIPGVLSQAQPLERSRTRLGVHDATRLEWSLAVPRDAGAYGCTLELEVPASIFAAHDPWAQLQSAARLDGAADAIDEDASFDEIRRATVEVAARLARAEEGCIRHARLVGSLAAATARSDADALLGEWLDVAERLVGDARAAVAGGTRGDEAKARELALADEYVSTRYIDVLAGAERALAAAAASRAPHLDEVRASVEATEERVAEMLERELEHRTRAGYVAPDASDPASLEAWVERASRLKKHFQEVLFLEREVVEVQKRVHHWVAAIVAVVASSWALAWQTVVAARGDGLMGTRVLAAAALASVIYATKDRMKEAGRTWLFGHVHRWYGQRSVRLRLPSRRLPSGDVVVRARERFDQVRDLRPDPLHPGSGAVAEVVILRFRHEGSTAPAAARPEVGARDVKLVFRYDFTPLFARLADATREVPVLDPRTRRLAFVEAARCYRVPVRFTVDAGDQRAEDAVLVISKRGLERIERAT